jgi:hypothetical protein
VVMAELECVFDSAMGAWRAETVTTSSVSAPDDTPTGLNVSVGGDMPVRDPVITITRTSGTITAIEFDIAAIGVELRWAGSLGASDVLTINAGAKTVLKNGADAYSGFTFGSGHTAKSWFWLPMPAGTVACTVRVVGGAATVAVTHYNQFA